MNASELAIRADLVEKLRAWDERRPRSQQREIGASQLGGCRRQVWYQIDGAPEINETEGLAALMGTGFHMIAEEAYGVEEQLFPDEFGYGTEMTVPGDPAIGLGPAHIDRYDFDFRRVVDYKTIKLKDLPYVKHGKDKHWWQGMVYGDRLIAAGYLVQSIALIYIPRDGTYADIHVVERPYDQRLADHAKDWLRQLWEWDRERDGLPPADFSGKICTDYCPFYGPELCLGKSASN